MCNCTAKLVITLMSLVILACSLFLFAVGGFMFVEYREDNPLDYSKEVILPASIIMGVAICLLIMALIGMVGAFKEHRCFLGVFATFLLIVIAGTITAAVVTFNKRKELGHGLKKQLMNDLQAYGSNDTVLTKEVDDLQKTLKCCGVNNFTDWKDTPWHKHKNTSLPYPQSCYPDNNGTLSCYDQGCYTKVYDGVMNHLNIIAGAIIGFIILLAIGVFLSCVLICQKRSEIPYIGLREPVARDGGMHV